MHYSHNIEECLAYHIEGIKQTNMYGNRSISSPDVRSFYCQPSSITSYHGSAASIVVIRYQRSYYREQWMVVITEEGLINQGKTTSKNRQASRCRHCCIIADDRGQWAVIAADVSVGVPQRRLSVMGIS